MNQIFNDIKTDFQMYPVIPAILAIGAVVAIVMIYYSYFGSPLLYIERLKYNSNPNRWIYNKIIKKEKISLNLVEDFLKIFTKGKLAPCYESIYIPNAKTYKYQKIVKSAINFLTSLINTQGLLDNYDKSKVTQSLLLTLSETPTDEKSFSLEKENIVINGFKILSVNDVSLVDINIPNAKKYESQRLVGTIFFADTQHKINKENHSTIFKECCVNPDGTVCYGTYANYIPELLTV